MLARWAAVAAVLACRAWPVHSAEPPAATALGLIYVEGDNAGRTSRAVVVDPGKAALVHTAQMLPLDAAGRIVSADDPTGQTEKVFEHLAAALAAADSGFDRAVKLNVYLRRTDVLPVVRREIARRFTDAARPAVTFVEGALPHPEALVAVDIVAAVRGGASNPTGAVKTFRAAGLSGSPGATHAAVLPAGPQVYVSGQVGAGKTLPDATRNTMEILRATLKHVGLDESHVVQLKAFVTPMSGVAEVEAEIAKFFPGRSVPPIVYVEWKSNIPIEIELVAASPAVPAADREPLEFLTPPGMTASPVFSRLTRINHGKTVYIGGLYGTSTAPGEPQVREIFGEMERLLAGLGGDLRHLAKATYYVADDETSRKLGEVRLKIYDPRRPPAASKALVPGVGFSGKAITIEMIALIPK
jgi:enamine deaminase RidA (YjgF/YER057c/UK114 family)